MLVFAIIFVTTALLFYSVGIVINLIKKSVPRVVFISIWLGVVFDAAGTFAMVSISAGFSLNFHSILGLSALGLMLIKAIINTRTYIRMQGTDGLYTRAYGLFSWAVWLVVYFSGMGR